MALESAQAGLSWATILHKREGYRTAFHHFDIDKCAAMTSTDVARLMEAQTATIVRNRAKIEAVIAECDVKKIEALQKTWAKVNADFGSIFSTLLPGTDAKLEPEEGKAVEDD